MVKPLRLSDVEITHIFSVRVYLRVDRGSRSSWLMRVVRLQHRQRMSPAIVRPSLLSVPETLGNWTVGRVCVGTRR